MNKVNTQIQKYIIDFISKIGLEFDSVEPDFLLDKQMFRIHTKDQNKLIGHKGEVLRAINFLIKQTLKQKGIYEPFVLDVNNYHTQQIEGLQNTAKLLAERARSLKYDVEMKPMTSYERMVVHSTLSEEKNITTQSVGVGRNRRVVIKYVAQEL